METINGWLLVYLIGSVPLLVVYSMGLSGWFFDYPMGLFIGIFLVLVVPLVLLVLKVPSAPTWNIAVLWVGAGLISRSEGLTMAAIVSVALAWAVVWTWYFLVSERVAKIFG
jgi:hypothetical protein